MRQQLGGKGKLFAEIHIGLQGEQRVFREADGIVVALIDGMLIVQIAAYQARKPGELDLVAKAAECALSGWGGRRRCRRIAVFLGLRDRKTGQRRRC